MQKPLSLFGAKHYMDQNISQRLGHKFAMVSGSQQKYLIISV